MDSFSNEIRLFFNEDLEIVSKSENSGQIKAETAKAFFNSINQQERYLIILQLEKQFSRQQPQTNTFCTSSSVDRSWWKAESYLITDKNQVLLILTDISEYRRAVAKLGELDDKLQQQSQQSEISDNMQEFIHILSHKLKTPLTILNWYGQMLSESEALLKLSKEEQAYFHEIQNAGKRIGLTVNKLLLMQKLEMGQQPFTPEKVDLLTEVKIVAENLKEEFSDKKLKIKIIKQPDHSSFALVDRESLKIILNNLLENSIIYNQEKEILITITIRRQTDKLFVEITDNGIGISDELAAKAFSKFFRSEAAKRLYTEGHGIGLHICKLIIEAIGESITLKGNKDEGVIISFTLPAAKA